MFIKFMGSVVLWTLNTFRYFSLSLECSGNKIGNDQATSCEPNEALLRQAQGDHFNMISDGLSGGQEPRIDKSSKGNPKAQRHLI